MSLQQTTVQRYRQIFPQDTLREVSARTGIQITRVFRLFSGKPMKVGELEAFQSVITKKIASNPGSARFSSLVDEALALLTDDELSKLNHYIERKISSKNYARMYVSLNNYVDAIA
jgi:hypothetical protein